MKDFLSIFNTGMFFIFCHTFMWPPRA
jgi:hypothetical protein